MAREPIVEEWHNSITKDAIAEAAQLAIQARRDRPIFPSQH
jgi:hypothetical protein